MASPAKLALARALSSRRVGIAVGTAMRHQIRNNGITFDTTGWDPRAEAMLAFRLYESAEIRFIRSYLPATEHAIELGGSLGVTGSHLLQIMAPKGRLMSVEANSALVPLLRATLLAHADGRPVQVVHAAITARPSPLLAASESNLTSRLAPFGVEVPAISLAAITMRAGYASYALVSDIEGSEASFIFTADGLEGCTRIVIELHETIHEGNRVTSHDMVAELERHGFRLLDRYGNVCAFSR